MDSLASATTPDAVATWLEQNLPHEPWAADAAAAAKQSNLTGAKLLAMTEAEAAAALGLTIFGRKRKLSILINDAKSATVKAEVVAPAVAAPAAAAAAAAAGSSSAGAAASSSSDPRDTAAIDAATCDRALQDESYALGLVQWSGGRLHSLLSNPALSAWAAPRLRSSRLSELEALNAKCVELPGVSVVVVGNTGAGKSTLLNALLGEDKILPTNGMRACTACLIEMRYEDSDAVKAPYRAEIEFLTQKEWDQELAELLDDLTPNDGPNAGRVNLSVAEDAVAYGSWCKVYAVYGDEFTHSRVRTDRRGPGDRVIYDNPTLESMKAKLARIRMITHALGSVKTETADEAKIFKRKCERYMDSVKDVSGGSYWPLVKQVRMYSRKWETLKTGAVLVDAPGVHDDNSARDAVVKRKLKEADAVWIVSNIVRAVNDKTAKDLLGEQFRRQLLMDGQFGSLAFIATQSDVIERQEAIRSLSLPHGTSLRECARARNEYTRRRLGQDFKAGLREMARDAGEGAARGDALAAKHALPVFTVSSVEYQKLKGLRSADGSSRVWSEIEDTEIPGLIRHVQRMALVRRKELSTRRCEAMRDFTSMILALLQNETRLPPEVREAARQAFESEVGTLQGELKQHANDAEKTITKTFEEDVAPKLKEGAETAKADAITKAQSWSISVTQGGLHWATYKATTRRNGVFRINMNEALVEPIFKAVATQWERSFLSGLSSTLDTLQTNVEASLGRFHPALLTALGRASVPSEASAALGDAQTDGLLSSLRSTVSDLKATAQKQQRDLSRSMEPTVQEKMTPGYEAATAECGTGSHRRRVAKLEGHLEQEAPKMFGDAIEGVVGKMRGLSETIGKTLDQSLVQGACDALHTTYSPLWDELKDTSLQARRALAPKVQEVLLEARNACRRLAEGGKESPTKSVGGDEDEEDDLVDVTDAARKAKRARQEAATIELDDEPMDEAEMGLFGGENAPPQSGAAGSSGVVKVKPEVKAEGGNSGKAKAEWA